MAIDGNYPIQKGDTLWAVAKRQLKAQGNAKPTNAQIVEAMNTIAQANGCKSPDECKDKFFNKIGSQLQVGGLFVERTDESPVADGTTQVSPISDKQKAQIDELRQLKSDSDQLADKLKENKDIETYAKYLENNSEFHVINTISHPDGSTSYVYGDSQDKYVGSTLKDSNGKVINSSLGLQDGANLSMNDRDGDGKIDDDAVAMGKVELNNDYIGIRYNRVLNTVLDQNDGYTVSKDERDNGTVAEHYFSTDGRHIATTIKNAEDEITQLFIYDGNHMILFNDNNGDDHVNEGEGMIRHDRHLDLSDSAPQAQEPPAQPVTVNDRMKAILEQAKVLGFDTKLVDDDRNV